MRSGDDQDLELIKALSPYRVFVAFPDGFKPFKQPLPSNASLLDAEAGDNQLPSYVDPDLILSLHRSVASESTAKLSAALHIPMILVIDGPPFRKIRSHEIPRAHALVFKTEKDAEAWLSSNSWVAGETWNELKEGIDTISSMMNFYNVWE